METQKATHNGYKTELFAPIIESTKGKYLAVLSDNSLDRDGERVGKSALYKMSQDTEYLAALVDHENKALNQVAQWVNKRVEDVDGHMALIAEAKFFKSNPKAQIIKGMLDEGAKMGISIGAIVKEYDDIKMEGRVVRTFTDLELLEASFVAIPSNKHGRAMALAKSFKKQMEDHKMELTQKDIDDAVSKKELELNKSFEEQLNEKTSEIDSLSKKLEEVEEEKEKSEEAVAEAEKKLKEVEEALELEKNKSIEKARLEEEEKEAPEEEAEKAFEAGKLPVYRG